MASILVWSKYTKSQLENRSIKISNTMSGIPKKQISCPYCPKIGGVPSMTRWHLNNCKYRGG